MSNATKVDSRACPLKELFAYKYEVDFYQREYVWQNKEIEDLINDLSLEFLKNWKAGDKLSQVDSYDPYFMGEIVVSEKPGMKNSIIDGQQRITTLTLLLIYIWNKYNHLDKFPQEIKNLICSDYYGEEQFNLEIEERKPCMKALFQTGTYDVQANDSVSVQNLVERYADISQCWNEKIDDTNLVNFAYWLKEKVIFSRVWTNSDEFAYVIFETMNDRGVSLTQVEMLRSYLLANIDEIERKNSVQTFDFILKKLMSIKLSSKSKAEFEFFKMYFRGHYAQSLSQSKDSQSDFVRIGKEFHRWVRENEELLNLNTSSDYVDFITRIAYFASVYERINSLIQADSRNTGDYLYLIVNSDYGFTMQPAVIMAAIAYNDDEETVNAKIKLISKYLTKILTWKVWNHMTIAQSALDAPIYELCKQVRDKSLHELKSIINDNPFDLPELNGSPTLNQQNKAKLRVLLALITEIVASHSKEPRYILNEKDIEVEHIWANFYSQHTDEFGSEDEFSITRNNIGDLLLLPKSFNASYGEASYKDKLVQYFSQNILAQTLNKKKYTNNPGFLKFKSDSGLPFEAYDDFKKEHIAKRASLYRDILIWNWQQDS